MRIQNNCRNTKILLAIALVLVVAISIVVIVVEVAVKQKANPSDNGVIDFPVSSSPLGVYRFAAVAADSGRCSQIGTQILSKGGSAVDGAIASTICNSIFNMQSAGIGGGFFMTIWDQATQTSHVLDAREMAPHYATEDMYEISNISSLFGPFSIAVPGEIAGYWAAHQRFGKVPWKWLFQPTIELCREGFAVHKILGDHITATIQEIELFPDKKPFQNLIDFFMNLKTGKPYKIGEVMYCNKLADTFDRIAEFGGPDFYNGSLADDILADLHEIGCPINTDDLANYNVVWRKPVETILQNRYRVISVPPPGSGAILGFILNILSGYNFTEKAGQQALTYHRFVEALKFAYAQRAKLGDADFVPGMQDLVGKLASPDYGSYIRSLIDDKSTKPTSYYDESPKGGSENHGTAHNSVIDSFGNAASITSTINTYFGSGMVGTRTGIIFNNEMDDFSSPNKVNYFHIAPSPSNFIQPGKRPQSSCCPAIVLVEDPNKLNSSIVKLVVGASGGSRITSATAYVTARVIWFKENVKQAVDALRLHHQWLPEVLHFDQGMPKIILESLYSKGHINMTEQKHIMSVTQAIERREDGSIFANSDYRKGSFCDGY